MRRQLNPIPLLVCCFLQGCMSAPPISVSTGFPLNREKRSLTTPHSWPSESLARELSAEARSAASFSFKDPIERQKAGFDDKLVEQIIADTHPGSLIEVGNVDGHYQGTLLSRDASGLRLMNCIGKEVVPGPEGQKQLKTSHVPFQTFKTSSMTRFMVISPPKPDFAPPDLNQDSRGLIVADIVYKDGTRQRRDQPIEASE